MAATRSGRISWAAMPATWPASAALNVAPRKPRREREFSSPLRGPSVKSEFMANLGGAVGAGVMAVRLSSRGTCSLDVIFDSQHHAVAMIAHQGGVIELTDSSTSQIRPAALSATDLSSGTAVCLDLTALPVQASVRCARRWPTPRHAGRYRTAGSHNHVNFLPSLLPVSSR